MPRAQNAQQLEIASLIDSLNLVEPSDPTTRWRPTLDALWSKLKHAERYQRVLGSLGPSLAVGAFFYFEGSRLDLNQLALILTAAAGFAAALHGPTESARQAAAGISGLAMAALHFFHQLNVYFVAAMLVTIAINYVLEKIYPALDRRDRIRALFRYFNFNGEQAHVAT